MSRTCRQINPAIAWDAAILEDERRDTIGYGIGLILGGAAMEDDYSLRALRVLATAAVKLGVDNGA